MSFLLFVDLEITVVAFWKTILQYFSDAYANYSIFFPPCFFPKVYITI